MFHNLKILSDGTHIFFPPFVLRGGMFHDWRKGKKKYELRNVFQGVVHREVKTGFGSYVLKTDTLMQSTRLIFEKKSKFDTLLKEKP